MRSGYEYRIRDDLTARGVDFDYEADVIDYVSPVRGGVCSECGCKKVGKNRKYNPDFTIHRSDQTKLFVEAKGRFPSTDRSKMRDVKRSNPHLDIRMLFCKRSKRETENVSNWCEKFGFEYAFGDQVPDTWLA